jgi:hypothetical protein
MYDEERRGKKVQYCRICICHAHHSSNLRLGPSPTTVVEHEPLINGVVNPYSSTGLRKSKVKADFICDN